MELALRPSEPRIISGPSHLFGPLAIGRIVNEPVPTTEESSLAGSRAGSLNPDFTCAPSQKGLSRECPRRQGIADCVARTCAGVNNRS